MKVLIIGSTGMLGHVVKRHFENQGYEVYNTSRDENDKMYFDAEKNITGIEKILKIIEPNVLINCIGILNKTAEDNKSLAVLINSYLPHYLDDLSKEYNYKFIHISTDCVFDGYKGEYSEDSEKDAKNFYGQSKSLGEINNDRNLTLRTSIVGPDSNPNGIGLFQWFMKQTGEVKGFTNAIWTGVTTVELAKQIEVAIQNNLSGIYHVVNGDKIDKYSLLQLFNKYFEKNIKVIPDDSYKCDKSLIITKKDFIFDIPSYDRMIKNMKQWMIDNLDLYEELNKSRCK